MTYRKVAGTRGGRGNKRGSEMSKAWLLLFLALLLLAGLRCDKKKKKTKERQGPLAANPSPI